MTMRLLFVTPQLPWPAAQGTTLRNFYLIQAAATRHAVDLLSFSADPAPDLGPLTRLCRRVETVPLPRRTRAHRLRDLVLGHADMERRLWSPALSERLELLLAGGGYDAVQLEAFEVAGALLGPAALRREAMCDGAWWPTVVFDDHNAEYELQASAARLDARLPRRWPRAAYSAIQARRLRRREALYCCAADLTLAVSEEDAAAIERIAPGVRALVVPNGIDCAAFPPPAPGPEPTIFFAGKLDYRPNVDACEWLVQDILPRVLRDVPGARVVLAGRDPAPAVAGLAGPHVEVTGVLSEEALARRRAAAWVYAVPMRMGSGVRFKALEALAAGVPLVATPLGASGAGTIHEQHALIASDAAAFAAALSRLLRNAGERTRLSRAGLALAEARHDWRHITPRLLDVYEQLRAPRKPVSVITTLLNERQSAPALLGSLAGQSRSADELVVADGGSTDGTQELVDAAARGGGAGVPPATHIRLLRVPGANISTGRNRAIAAAAHDTIAATDGGVVLAPGWLERLTAPLARHADLAGVSGFFVASPQTLWERALGATTLPEVEEITPTGFLPSSRSVAFRRSVWDAAGRYPEWLDYCEDLVFDLALTERCGPLRFQPRAVARFRPRPTPATFFRQYYRYARGDGKAGLFARRHAIRYATYGGGMLLALHAALGRPRLPSQGPSSATVHTVSRALALFFLATGAITYVHRPLQRLGHQSAGVDQFAAAAPLIPIIRVIGDAAKMLGYPPGVLWRLRQRLRTGAWPEHS